MAKGGTNGREADGTEAGRAGSGRAASASGRREPSEGQRAYEARRASEAGLGLDAWMARKARAAASAAAAAAPPRPPKPKGMIGRLLDRLHRPI